MRNVWIYIYIFLYSCMDIFSQAPSALLKMPQQNLFQETHPTEEQTPVMSRRRFGKAMLHIASAFLYTGVTAAVGIGHELNMQSQVRATVQGDADNFQQIYGNALNQTELMASFSPRHFDHFSDTDMWPEFKGTNSSAFSALEAFTIVHSLLGFKNIRLGIPLPDIHLNENKKLIIDNKHRELIEYSILHDMNIILNLPPRVFA